MHTHRFYHRSEEHTRNAPLHKSYDECVTGAVKQTCLPALVEGKRACFSQRRNNKDNETRATVPFTTSM